MLKFFIIKLLKKRSIETVNLGLNIHTYHTDCGPSSRILLVICGLPLNTLVKTQCKYN